MNKKYLLPIFITLGFVLIFWAVYSQTQMTAPVRQAWEYKRLAVVRGLNGEFTTWSENSGGGDIQLAAPVNVHRRLNELGYEGWELIAVTPISNSSAGNSQQISYFLKRPR